MRSTCTITVTAKLWHRDHGTQRIADLFPTDTARIRQTIRAAKIIETEVAHGPCKLLSSHWRGDKQTLRLRFFSCEDIGSIVDALQISAADGYMEDENSVVKASNGRRLAIVFNDIKIEFVPYW